MPEIPIGGSFYKMSSAPISAQECVNFRANIPEKTTTSRKNLLRTDGLMLATTAGSSVCRGEHTFLSKPYFVQGNDLYRVDQTIDGFGDITYSATQVNGATSIAGTERVIIADNGTEGDQMVIVTPDSSAQFNAYVFDGSAGTLTAVSDADFDGPVSDVNYVDGYFWFTKKADQKVFISDLRDGTAYSATDIIDADADPDSNVRSFILRGIPYVFGTKTFQGFQSITASGGFPFTSIRGSTVRKGLASKYAIEEIDDNMVFLGGSENETPAIWISNGGTVDKLSTTPIDDAIASYALSIVQNAYSWKYSLGGARFVGFTFPTKRTFVFDFLSKEWHTRESVDSDGATVPYRITGIIKAYGNLFCGDSLSAKIGILDKDTLTDYSEQVSRYFVLPPIDNEGEPFFIDAVECVMNTGLGLATGQGSDPQIALYFSKDGGRTFSNAINRSAGAQGAYNTRVIWANLGRFPRDMVVKFAVSDPVDWAITKIEAKLE